MTEEARAWWETIADDFQADLDLPVGVNWTGFGTAVPGDEELDLLADVAGADVLELGCGGGQCSVALARRGADVTGIDISRAELAHARSLAEEHGVSVDFLEGDVRDLSMLADDAFDVALNTWVFQWVDDLGACFEGARRVLRPDGRFVFSMPHPCYDLVDPETHEVVESYFDSPRQVTEVEGLDVDSVTYRHRVGDVHTELRSAGFRVEQLLEPGSVDPADYEDDPWGTYRPELMAKLPSTLLFDARPIRARGRSN